MVKGGGWIDILCVQDVYAARIMYILAVAHHNLHSLYIFVLTLPLKPEHLADINCTVAVSYSECDIRANIEPIAHSTPSLAYSTKYINKI